MDACYGFVEQLIDEIYESRDDFTPEMSEILSLIIQSDEIDKSCEDPLWFFTDLIVGAWIGPALTQKPLHFGIKLGKFSDQDKFICAFLICRMLLEMSFLGLHNLEDYPYFPQTNTNNSNKV